MPDPFYRPGCGGREMADLDRRRWEAVRAAGWRWDGLARVWRHQHTGRTGLNQHVIYECLRNHDAMPPCGNSREETPRDVRQEWQRRRLRLLEIEHQTGRLVPCSLGVQITDTLVEIARAGAARHGRPPATRADWQPNVWEA